MNHLLTIAVPTYNRSQLLNNQLNWLSHAIEGLESNCEIIISDNCSTDNTQEIIQKWLPFLSKTKLILKRQNKNIGAVRNIAYCIKKATSRYVWTISDDDPIQPQAIAYILENLSEHPDLSLLILNLSIRNIKTGKLTCERCFAIEHESIENNGKAVFERCLKERFGDGVALTTAVVYRTYLAQQALKSWSTGLSDNLLVQLYWSGYCALYGSVKVSQQNYLECIAGDHHFSKNRLLSLKLKYTDLPESFLKLIDLGYSPKIGKPLAIGLMKDFKLYDILRLLTKSPKLIFKTILFHLKLLFSSQIRSYRYTKAKLKLKFQVN